MAMLLMALGAALWLVWVGGLLVFRRRPELRVGAPREFVFPLAVLLFALACALAQPGSALGVLLAIHLRVGLMVALLVTLVWVISLLMRDSSIMDVAYPLVPALPIVVLIAWRGTWSPHEVIAVALAGLWSLRLAAHIGIRNLGHGEDRRYAAWRTRFGQHYWWWSFFMIFAAQGTTVWLWVLPLTMAVVAAPAALGWQHVLALVLFAVGFYFQAVGDAQLERFKKRRTDRSMVLDTGVWSLTRHPNYFGEVMIWWSFGALGLVHPWGWVALLSPAYVTWMMCAGSATPMQERYLTKTKPAYADYMARVPAFFPWSKP